MAFGPTQTRAEAEGVLMPPRWLRELPERLLGSLAIVAVLWLLAWASAAHFGESWRRLPASCSHGYNTAAAPIERRGVDRP